MSRRQALAGLASFVAASPLIRAQQDPATLAGHRRVPGFTEMVTPWDFESVFKANVPQAVYDYTARGTDSEFTMRRNRDAFDWVTLERHAPIDVTFGRYIDRDVWAYAEQPDHARAHGPPAPAASRRRARDVRGGHCDGLGHDREPCVELSLRSNRASRCRAALVPVLSLVLTSS